MSYEEKQLEQLRRGLKNRDGWKRSAAATRIGELKVTDAIDDLVKTLKDDRDSLVRSSAAAALGNLGPEAQKAVAVLIETLEKDRIVGVRLEAAVALGKIADQEIIPTLTKIALEDKDIRVRAWAADAIRKIKQ